MKNPPKIDSATGKLGILLVGMGAVSTTTIAGVLAVRRGLASPIGSLTQMGTVRLGKRTEGRSPLIRDFVPLASLGDVVFGGWDIFEDNSYEAAKTAGVLEENLLNAIRPELEAIKPMPAVFDRRYVKRLDGPNVKKGKNKKELADQLGEDMRRFKEQNRCDRLVMIWCGSTEIYAQEGPAHQDLAAFEKALEASDVSIPSSMIYAYAAIKEGIPYANGAPNLSADIPALQELAAQTKTPITGKDFKTGQTLIKTVLAPMLKARMLGLSGWYSTNILGNRDGEVGCSVVERHALEQGGVGVQHRRGDRRVVGVDRFLERRNVLMRRAHLEEDLGRTAPHHHHAIDGVVIGELVNAFADTFEHLAL